MSGARAYLSPPSTLPVDRLTRCTCVQARHFTVS
jgi:hypothetical protein